MRDGKGRDLAAISFVSSLGIASPMELGLMTSVFALVQRVEP